MDHHNGVFGPGRCTPAARKSPCAPTNGTARLRIRGEYDRVRNTHNSEDVKAHFQWCGAAAAAKDAARAGTEVKAARRSSSAIFASATAAVSAL
ncbi:hypothetical protein OG373_02815 [Streptomyces avidinii]|uniref:hypothetical protein n=1 Tax=Streptomyces avidinii TaxID=1895 RepID=UPI00386B73A0|nr:hypothetical protein OG373_02815 [Streptomyces avidinii]